jgi:hypothetical protein
MTRGSPRLAVLGAGHVGSTLARVAAGAGSRRLDRRFRRPDGDRADHQDGRTTLQVITNVSKSRGFRIPTKESFMHDIGPDGALYIGSPETVAQKIAANMTAVGPLGSTSSTAWADSRTTSS